MPEADYVAPEVLAAEFERILNEGEQRGLVLRAFGGVGFYLHSRDRSLFVRLGRDPINDLDLVGLSEQRNEVKKLFRDLNYHVDWDLLVAGEGRRFLFQRVDDPPVEVDLFIDRLEMNHRIEFRDRLRLQPSTLPLVDLLLQKLQIVQLNRKDIVDLVVLLAEHELGGEGPGSIDTAYMARLLGDDWGFYYTVTLNLQHVREFLAENPIDVHAEVEQKLDRLQRDLEAAPKSRRWKMRARIGTKVKWYDDVDEAQAF